MLGTRREKAGPHSLGPTTEWLVWNCTLHPVLREFIRNGLVKNCNYFMDVVEDNVRNIIQRFLYENP